MKTAILLYILAFSSLSAAPFIDIKLIAGKSTKEVDKVLGAPTSIEKTSKGPKRIYKNGIFEVVFINKKADWITITPPAKKGYNFSRLFLKELGLEDRPPSFSNQYVMKWEPYKKYRSISIFPGVNGLDYAYIMVNTK